MSLRIQDDYLQHLLSIAKVFSSATGLTAVVVDVSGETPSDCHNFSSFCTLIRADGRYCVSCQKCDKHCTFEGSKHLKSGILNCHTGLNLFSTPLTREGRLYGSMLCRQVRTKYQEYKTIVIDSECLWMDGPKTKAEWSQVTVVDSNTLVASANLLSFIVDSFETEQQQSGEFVIPPTSYTRHYFTELSRHEKKLLAALRYIDKSLYDELSLESVATHVCLSASHFSHFFKKRQGVNFEVWVDQKKA